MKTLIYSVSTLLTICVLCIPSVVFGQEAKNTLSGYVKEASTGETLIGATVYIKEIQAGTSTNAYGFYSLTVPPGAYTVEWSYIGYQTTTQSVNLSEDIRLDIELLDEATQIEEVVVSAKEEDENVSNIQMSVEKLDAKTLTKIPSLLGETDVLRAIQLLPGITSVGEGAAGFNVRGGSIDQNLVIMDEAPVYNSSHLFGFFSVFNPDAVKDVQLYKGGIPARYGGRLSSILDVRLKEGNAKRFAFQGGIGTIFSRLALEAPIVKDKASFIIAGRRSYIDVLARPFSEDIEDTALNFFDLTLKTNYRPNENNQLFLSGYFGRDNFRFGDQAGFSWGNRTATFRWNHIFNDRLFSNLTAYWSDYDYEIRFGDTDADNFDWNARIKNYSIKPEFAFYISPDNVLRFGGQSILYEFEPANAVSIIDNQEIDISLEKQYALESGLFIENEISLAERFKILYGIRLSHFNYIGSGVARSYGEAEEIGLERPFLGAEFFDSGESIQQYLRPEPRLNVQYTLSPTSSLKASYMRTAQYIHLLSNTTASTPVDIWTPSTNNLRPQTADQVALGYFRNFKDNMFELGIEGYYKRMNNILDYIDGADLILNQFVEGQILAGRGRAYGMELELKKPKGRFNGWISYTLARSESQVDGINNNDWYPNRFDQTHTFNITGFYELSERVSLSGTFVFNSGTPTTFPASRFEQQGFVIPHNDGGARNNVRIPNYHRLDLSVTIDGKKKPGKKWQGQWVIGVYNLYGRRNPFSIYFRQQEGRNPSTIPVVRDESYIPYQPATPIQTEAIRLSVIGNFIPAISYNFKFNHK